MSVTLEAPAAYPSLGPWFDRDAEKWFEVVRVGNQLILEGDGETFWLSPDTGLIEDIERGNYEDQLVNLVTGDFETATDRDELGNVIWAYLTETGEEDLNRKVVGSRREIEGWLTAKEYDGLAAIWARGGK
jgi:hypothetical protein